MPGSHLSRWTLAWFGAGLGSLLLACGLVLAGGAGPQDWARGSGLAAVHLFALGWLGLVVQGALIQFVPVLSARQLAFPALALPALIASAAGAMALGAGFYGLDGAAALRLLFVAAPGLIGLGFALLTIMIGGTVVNRVALGLAEVQMLLLAFVALAALWLSGTVLALTLSGVAFVVERTAALPLHMMLGIAGWLSVAAFGVSYKLFAMFLLAPEKGGRLRRAVFVAAGLSLVFLLVGLLEVLVGRAPVAATAAAVGFLPLTGVLYLAEITRLWRSRRRLVPEVHMLCSRAGLAFLGLATLLAVPGWRIGGAWAEAAVFAALVGWLSTLTLAQMVKIVSFLTWIQIFAPRIGRQPVPTVHKLIDAKAVAACLGLWSAGAAFGCAALLLGSSVGFKIAIAMLTLAVLRLVRELIAILRLTHLAAHERPARVSPLILPVLKPNYTAEPRS